MGHLDPALTTILWTAGAALLTALAQLAVALAGYIKSKANSVSLAKANDKLDVNTTLTADIHKVTNGPLSAMSQNVTALATQADANAAEARSTALAAKVQAAVDAAVPVIKPPEKVG